MTSLFLYYLISSLRQKYLFTCEFSLVLFLFFTSKSPIGSLANSTTPFEAASAVALELAVSILQIGARGGGSVRSEVVMWRGKRVRKSWGSVGVRSGSIRRREKEEGNVM